MTPEPAAIDATPPDAARAALHRVVILLALVGLVFRSELWWIARFAVREPEAAPALAAPIIIGLLWWRRRGVLAASAGRGSWWGLAPLALAIVVLAAATWSSFGLPGRLAFVLACAGAILAGAGWRTLWHAGPLLVVTLACIPLGPRTFALLTRRAEQTTLRIARALVEAFPGVDFVELRGPDLHFVAGATRDAIALGEPHRGAALLAASGLIVLVVAFARVRPAWQLAVFAVAILPIVAIGNLTRLLAWAACAVYGGAGATDAWPRLVAATVALVLAWSLAALVGWILDHLVVAEAR